MRLLLVALCALTLMTANAYAFTISKFDAHHVLHQMGFAMGTAWCDDFQINWLAHDLIFDWAEVKLGENIELEQHKKHGIAGADEADALMKESRSHYCAELWNRFGESGNQIPGLILQK